jgi:putative transposase
MRWRCLAYCLMDNHLHLVLETPHGNLSRGMQRLHGGYAQAFNNRHDRVGHVFQGRYGAGLIESTEQLLAAVAYVARNPVEAGLCTRPEEWPWSSFRAVVEPHARSPDWLDVQRLLSHFGPPSETAVQRYARMTMLERALGGAVPKEV